MTLCFQPLYAVGSRTIVSFEALSRWTSPVLGVAPPDVFIGVAERSDIIHTITRVMLRKALAAAKQWPENIGLSFNLSIRDLLSSIATTQIIAIIESSGIDPRRIDLEVTEAGLMTDFDRAEASILAFKRIGLKISLDDLGTGYSSLSYVHRLPLDKIKIDRSFVEIPAGELRRAQHRQGDDHLVPQSQRELRNRGR
jgi:predicted signal transduction protein with EAL and GGDEF domain